MDFFKNSVKASNLLSLQHNEYLCLIPSLIPKEEKALKPTGRLTSLLDSPHNEQVLQSRHCQRVFFTLAVNSGENRRHEGWPENYNKYAY